MQRSKINVCGEESLGTRLGVVCGVMVHVGVLCDIIHFIAPAEDTSESERWEHLLVSMVTCVVLYRYQSFSERGREDDETATDACVAIS